MISGSNLIFNYLKRIYFCDHSFFARFKLLHYVEIDAAGTDSLTLFGIALYCSVSNKRMFRGQYPTWDSANAFIRDLRRYWFKSLNILPSARSSHQRCSIIKGVLRNFTKFTGKHLCQSLFFNKVAGLRPATLLKKRLWHKCFPVNFAKFLRTHFLHNTSGRLLLQYTKFPS